MRVRELRALGVLSALSWILVPAACSTFSGGEAPPPADDAAPADGRDRDADVASEDATPRPDGGCSPGSFVSPTQVDVESFGGAVGSYVCTGSPLDGGVDALAVIAPGLNYDIVPGRRLTGCIRADFGAALPLDRVEVVARSVTNASGCPHTGDPTQPTTGADLYVSSADAPAPADYAAITLASVNADAVSIGAAVKPPIRYLLVCRTNQPAALLAIEGIRARCR